MRAFSDVTNHHHHHHSSNNHYSGGASSSSSHTMSRRTLAGAGGGGECAPGASSSSSAIAPSRRPQATAFQPHTNSNSNHHGGYQQAGGSYNNYNSSSAAAQQGHHNPHHNASQIQPASSTPPSQSQSQSNNNNNNNNNEVYVPASSTTAGEMTSRLDVLTNQVMNQLKVLSRFRDGFGLENPETPANQRIVTMVSQIAPLFSESEEIIKRMQREEFNKVVPINNKNISSAAPSSMLQERGESHDEVAASGSGSGHLHPPTSSSSSAPPQHENNNNEEQTTSVPVPSSRPVATRRATAIPKSSSFVPDEERIQVEKVETQQQVQQQDNNNNEDEEHSSEGQQQQQQTGPGGYQILPRVQGDGIALPQRQNKRYIRASQVVVQQENAQGGVTTAAAATSAASSGGSIDPNWTSQGGASGEQHQGQQGSLAHRGAEEAHLRRLQRGEAHRFAVVEFKCHRMKRYPCGSNIQPGSYVMCWGDKGEDCGLVVLTGYCDEFGYCDNIVVFQDMDVQLGRVRQSSDIFLLRNATSQEVDTLHGELASYEETALEKCQEMALQRGLDMQFTDCEIQFDRQKFTFYFNAGQSVDFRELTRDLHRLFRARIWLENINANVKNVVPEGALSNADKKVYAARGVKMQYR